MKIFIVYKWDCMIRWVLFGLVALLAFLSSDAIELIDNPITLSAFSLLIYLFIPIHPILWLISLIFSIKNKQLPKNQQFKTTITAATLIALQCMS